MHIGNLSNRVFYQIWIAANVYLDEVQNWLTLISCQPLFLLLLRTQHLLKNNYVTWHFQYAIFSKNYRFMVEFIAVRWSLLARLATFSVLLFSWREISCPSSYFGTSCLILLNNSHRSRPWVVCGLGGSQSVLLSLARVINSASKSFLSKRRVTRRAIVCCTAIAWRLARHALGCRWVKARRVLLVRRSNPSQSHRDFFSVYTFKHILCW